MTSDPARLRHTLRRTPLRLRLRLERRGLAPLMDGPDELPSEVVDVATGELAERRRGPGR